MESAQSATMFSNKLGFWKDSFFVYHDEENMPPKYVLGLSNSDRLCSPERGIVICTFYYLTDCKNYRNHGGKVSEDET